jgi:hypothetical protein
LIPAKRIEAEMQQDRKGCTGRISTETFMLYCRRWAEQRPVDRDSGHSAERVRMWFENAPDAEDDGCRHSRASIKERGSR